MQVVPVVEGCAARELQQLPPEHCGSPADQQAALLLLLLRWLLLAVEGRAA
jgi:hypothetical protein